MLKKWETYFWYDYSDWYLDFLFREEAYGEISEEGTEFGEIEEK